MTNDSERPGMPLKKERWKKLSVLIRGENLILVVLVVSLFVVRPVSKFDLF
jgi:hypothetical protein